MKPKIILLFILCVILILLPVVMISKPPFTTTENNDGLLTRATIQHTIKEREYNALTYINQILVSTYFDNATWSELSNLTVNYVHFWWSIGESGSDRFYVEVLTAEQYVAWRTSNETLPHEYLWTNSGNSGQYGEWEMSLPLGEEYCILFAHRNLVTLIASIGVDWQFVPPPNYTMVEESINPIVGRSTTITITGVASDKGISNVLIDLDGNNYTMIALNESVWQYSWIPTNASIHNYIIYIEDAIGQWTIYTGSIEIESDSPIPAETIVIITIVAVGAVIGVIGVRSKLKHRSQARPKRNFPIFKKTPPSYG